MKGHCPLDVMVMVLVSILLNGGYAHVCPEIYLNEIRHFVMEL